MHILVADDDLPSVKLTSFLLEEAGYRVFKAYDGPSIMQALEQYNPDLILLDVSMPKSNGFDICRQIRRTSDVPIIFLSARSQLQDRVTGLRSAATTTLLSHLSHRNCSRASKRCCAAATVTCSIPRLVLAKVTLRSIQLSTRCSSPTAG